MGKKKNDSPKSSPPPLNPDAKENQMISLAQELAEQRLKDGTASSQLVVHYLKLGTAKARLEKQLLSAQVELAKAKTEAYQAAKDHAVSYEKAVEAMRRYGSAAVTPDEGYEIDD